LARSNFSFEKRRKELEKKKKKELKAQLKAEKKAALEAGETLPEPIITIDEFGNVVETMPEVEPGTDTSNEGATTEEPDPA
jgi:S-adenosylmethionine hydrolase